MICYWLNYLTCRIGTFNFDRDNDKIFIIRERVFQYFVEGGINILNRTKKFMRDNDLNYKREYIRPMMTPEHVYIFRFGRHRLNNRVIVRYSHTWTGRLKINEIDVRLHHQHHPRIFKTETDLILYLQQHMDKEQKKTAQAAAQDD